MRLAINGYGRIGRCVLRAASLREDCKSLDFVAINELAAADALAYLTRYDSTHGRFPGGIEHVANKLEITTDVNRYSLEILSQESFDQTDGQNVWQDRSIDLLLECTGQFGTMALSNKHLLSGAQRVLLSYPGESVIPAVVYGVNHLNVDCEQAILSAASCTSNALLPVISVLHKAFGIQSGVITTIHASMHDQPVIDAYHSDDLRKNRSASQSIIPVDTELAAGVGRIIPELDGKFIAHALRVPVSNVSSLNVTLNLQSDVSVEQVNELLRSAASQQLKGVLGFSEEQLASCDFIGDARSSVVDGLQTDVVGSRTVNLLIWFDNEWAYANRMLDIALMISR